MNFKENLFYVMKQRGVTGAEVARRLDVSRQAFQYYLKGSVNLRTLGALADVLDTTPATLLSEVPLSELEAIPTRQRITATALVCPCCGAELKILAKGEPPKEKKEGE